jgi:DNA-binding transcriptional regulator PaaX
MPITRRQTPYNTLKRHTLKIFERHGTWLSPSEWAALAGFYPVRAGYSYLLRLYRFGLLERDPSGRRLHYRLSDKGKRRLAWLAR